MVKPVALLEQFGQEFGKDKVGQLSAAFAYSAIFSIGPLLLVFISIVSLIYGRQAAQGQLFAQLSSVVGSSSAQTIQSIIANSQSTGKGVIGIIIGGLGLLLGAAVISSQLQNSFNFILGVVPDPKGGLKRTLYVKFKNVGCVLLGGVLIAASLVLSALAIGLGKSFSRHLGLPAIGLEIFNELVSLAVFSVLLYAVFRILPDLVVPRRVVWRVTVIVAFLFMVGKIVLSIIIGRNATASAYGAAAALVSLLLWIYYSGQIVLIGAEIMKIYGFNHSLEYKPKKFSLKRSTVHLDNSEFLGKLIEAWLRGFRKRAGR